MTDDCNKPVWPWIVALLIGLPALYVASFGPACWLHSAKIVPYDVIDAGYRPLLYMAFDGPEVQQHLLTSYVHLWRGEQALLIWYLLDKQSL